MVIDAPEVQRTAVAGEVACILNRSAAHSLDQLRIEKVGVQRKIRVRMEVAE